MSEYEIAYQRLTTQHIAGSKLQRPEQVVDWLAAVQSQDYAAATWALGLRLQDAGVNAVDAAFNAGAILRTHVMRPTWHFVTPADIRWLLELTAPRVHALNANYYRKSELDDALIDRCNDIIANALQGRNYLTREELAAVLQQSGIATRSDNNMRLAYIMMHAELDGVICSGPRRGKQFTYALLDERAPNARRLERDEALAELVRRYFTAHGPATIKDFVWWSGLTTTLAKAGLEMVRDQIREEVIKDRSYWMAERRTSVIDPSPTAYLLPNYDEYGVGYADHDEILAAGQLVASGFYFGHMIFIDSQLVGAWKRQIGKGALEITIQAFRALSAREQDAVAAAAERYGEFMGLPVRLQYATA